jgi:hypothetical protein
MLRGNTAPRCRFSSKSTRLSPRQNPHSARGAAFLPSRDFVPWRFSNAGRPRVWRVWSRRRPKTCTSSEVNS